MPSAPFVDLATLDLNQLVRTREQIYEVLPHRFEFMQLDGIVHMDPENWLAVAVREVREDEFWVRGHMPGYPLMPGVLMCEASAQLCCYYSTTQGIVHGDFLGFGGMDNVRFRSQVRPGDRLVLVAKGLKFHRRQIVFNVQGFVAETMVFHADIIGMPLQRQQEG